MTLAIKTRSEQMLEQLESLGRPLTDAEREAKRRCEHAIYMKHWRAERDLTGPALAKHGKENEALLAKVQREAQG